ncbi:hypothetical protein QYS49_11860 [Marivirga salinae]|uniref:ApeA N-terminal domain-containing protein n=1 Tax=Marivirga salinarum TaxID=3059078 RepID=A0AA51RCH9_9BACT|nr:HEPN domain-containing protein [Marivirga sp. BDSF4-3]WMN11733.1 hypothetical protein QYS49_11860 [Marivirga sp. BDSF4-3]
MFTDFEVKGQWFQPHDLTKKVAGTLRFEVGIGMSLETIGSLSSHDEDPEIILGVSTEGHHYTLIDNLTVQSHFSSKGIPTRKYSIHETIKNGHFSSIDELYFDCAYFQFNLLEEWIGKSIFDIDESFANRILEVKTNQTDAIEFSIDDITEGKIHFNRTGLSRQRLQKKIVLEQENVIELEFNQLISLESLLEYQRKFQYFLTLATAENVFPKKIEVTNTQVQNQQNQILEVYFTPHAKDQTSVESKIDKFMLFNFKNIESRFESILKNWFLKCDELQPVIYLLFNNLYNKKKFSSFSFLAIIQALETFHRYLNQTPESTIKKHEARVKRISDSLTGKDKKWIKYKLKYAFEPSLQDRLNNILDNYSTEIVLKLIGNRDDFIAAVVNDRNFYTHYDRRLENTKMNISELMRVTGILQLLLITCILVEIGFDEDQLLEIHKNGRHVSHLIKQVSNN